MHMTFRFAAAASLGATLFLAACDSKPVTVTAGGADPTANQVAAAPPVALPPPIEASRIYRCKDASVVYVDFLGDKLTADFRTDKDGPPTKLTAPEAGKPFVAEGYSIGANAASTQIASPGKAAQTCKA